jgi:hypothetical protein
MCHAVIVGKGEVKDITTHESYTKNIKFWNNILPKSFTFLLNFFITKNGLLVLLNRPEQRR